MLIGSTQGLTGSTGSQGATAQLQLQDDLNKFLNLLITQLKNQDPLDPLDTNELTSQLVQFASVEQQIYQNQNLEKLLKLQETSQVAVMVNYLGTTVEAVGDKFNLTDSEAAFTYALPTNAQTVKINIQNANGITVYNSDGELKAGRHKFEWDGKANGGAQQPDGIYTVTVTAFDAQKNLIPVQQTVFGRVTGAAAENGEVFLFVGDIATPMDQVLAVKETPQPAL